MRFVRLSRLQRREKLLLWLCLAAALAALGMKYAVGPYLSKWNTVQDNIGRRERMLVKGTLALARQNTANQAYGTMMAKIQSKGSSEEEIAAFLSEVASLSPEGVRITDIKPRKTDAGRTFTLISIDVDVEAAITPLSRFIYDLYQSPMLLDLEQVDLSPMAPGSGTLKGRLVVSRILFRS